MRGRSDIRSQRGQTIVEFAMVLPILALLLFGVIQFGITFNKRRTTAYFQFYIECEHPQLPRKVGLE